MTEQDRLKSKMAHGGQLVERRRCPRAEVDSVDWETKVLMRVESHVELLTRGGAVQTPDTRHLDWEKASLVALQRRLRGLKTA